MKETQKMLDQHQSLKQLGRQIRLQRHRLGLDQAQIQGIRQATISKIENGQGGMLNTFISYAASLGLEVTLTPLPAAEIPQPPRRTTTRTTPARHRLEPAG